MRRSRDEAVLPRSHSSVAAVGLGLAITLLSWPASRARADGPWEGQWREGTMRIDVQIESWGTDCGRRPESTSGPGGGTVQVTQDGDHLVFRGQRTTRTNGCWSENRAVRRISSSFQAGTWRSTCKTPDEDPRAETGTYTLRAAGNDRLDFTDVSRYDWTLNTSHCTATITTTQSFTRVGSAPAPSPTATPTPSPSPTARPEPEPVPTCTAGAPARVALRPSQSSIEPGGRVCLTARVLDAAGCPVRGAAVNVTLERPGASRGELQGTCFVAAQTAAEAEGVFTIVATAGGLRDAATVRVQTADLSDLIARRGTGLVGGALPTAQGEARASTSAATRVAQARTEDDVYGEYLPLVIGGGVLAAVLLVLVIVLARRRSQKPAPSFDDSSSAFYQSSQALSPAASVTKPQAAGASAAAAVPAGPRTCPACGGTFEGVAACPKDGTTLVEPSAVASASATTKESLICPICRRGYPPDGKFCPHDAGELVPYSVFAARAKAGAGGETQGATASKVCPRCGSKYGADMMICGKDGSPLTTVN